MIGEHQVIQANKYECANALKAVKRLCTKLDFTDGLLKDSSAHGRKKL